MLKRGTTLCHYSLDFWWVCFAFCFMQSCMQSCNMFAKKYRLWMCVNDFCCYLMAYYSIYFLSWASPVDLYLHRKKRKQWNIACCAESTTPVQRSISGMSTLWPMAQSAGSCWEWLLEGKLKGTHTQTQAADYCAKNVRLCLFRYAVPLGCPARPCHGQKYIRLDRHLKAVHEMAVCILHFCKNKCYCFSVISEWWGPGLVSMNWVVINVLCNNDYCLT